MRTAIASIRAWEALDSRGMPTVACEVKLVGGARGRAIVPSGASKGTHEVRELRDGGARYGGRGVRRAVAHVRGTIAPAVAGADAADLCALDALLCELDGSPSLERLGGNAILSVSIASALAAADAEGIPLYRLLTGDTEPLLPLPMVNIVSGGAHAARAVDLQDFLTIPVGAQTFAQALEWAWLVRRGTAEAAAARGLEAALVADEGGLGPPLRSNEDALRLLAEGIERAGLEPGTHVAIALDVAATHVFDGERYRLAAEGRGLDAGELIDELERWTRDYPIVSLEDPLAEDDWGGWRAVTARLGSTMQVVGDDLFATSVERLQRGAELGAANAILVKPNQAGTLTRTRAALERARELGYATIISARSGDTEDTWLADLAVGWRAGQIKVGSVTRSERTAKWNRLLEIEDELGEAARFAGKEALSRS